VTWALDGPGSLEIDIVPEDMGDQWQAGLRRVRVNEDATVRFTGFLEHLGRSGAPDAERYRAAGLGIASRLDQRVVHGDFTRNDVVATDIAWDLIQHAQNQADGGLGITLGTITGTAPSRTRHFCDGDVIAEQIGNLAAMEPGGFFWEIDPLGAFNAWVGDRGSASGQTLAEGEAILFEIEDDTSDLLTYVTALGEADEPCGAPLEVRSSTLATAYGRRESTVDSDTRLTTELDQLADHELLVRGRSRRSVKASWIEAAGYRPWTFGDVWLGDTLTVELDSWFGGTQTMRVVTIVVSLEFQALEPFITYEMQAV
jgi:hypothetical protein